MSATPFTDPALIKPLYARPGRLSRRTSALRAAKINGPDATTTIVALTGGVLPNPARIVDIGCGRGTSTIALANRWPGAQVIALDQSPGLLAETGTRLRHQGHRALLTCADFHHLPFSDQCVDLLVAAFCLYHSPEPSLVLAEFRRCLTRSGRAVLVTKSADSYHDIDELFVATGLDPEAGARPSLYRTFHRSNAARVVTSAGLAVEQQIDERHTFQFADLDHLAAYAATSPKYQLPSSMSGHAEPLAAALRQRVPDSPLVTTSTVTYLLVRRS
jgi:ubiquinone/menaquinone biosynthesis C-methylase UbiE